MGIRVNGTDYNLPTLAGEVVALTTGHTMPFDLYVFGTTSPDRRIYIDPNIPNGEQIVDFLSAQEIHVFLEMPYSPNSRPAIAISRGMRDDEYILEAARVCAFVLFCMHETIQIEQEWMDDIFENINPNERQD